MENSICIFILVSIQLVLVSCTRRDVLDRKPAVAVQVRFDWEEAAEAGPLPEGMRVIFYPKDAEGRKADVFLPVNGGEVKVSPGRYSVVAYNYDTETVLVREAALYATIEAYTNFCRLGIEGTEEMVWGPDRFYTVNIDNFETDDISQPLVLDLTPRLAVNTYSFNLKTIRIENMASAFGSVEGLADQYLLGKNCGKLGGNPIYFDVSKGEGTIKGSFTSFGKPEQAASRAEPKIVLKLVLTKVDRTVQKVEVDITQAVSIPDNGSGNNPLPEIKLPEGEAIVIGEVEALPDNGGFGGEVGGWEDETEVTLPLKSDKETHY